MSYSTYVEVQKRKAHVFCIIKKSEFFKSTCTLPLQELRNIQKRKQKASYIDNAISEV